MTRDFMGMTPLLSAYSRKDRKIIDCIRQADKQSSPEVHSRLYKRGVAHAIKTAIKTDDLDIFKELNQKG